MKRLSLLVVCALLLSGASAVPAFADSPAPLGVATVNEARLIESLASEGITVEDLTQAADEIVVATSSALGSGVPVHAVTAVDISESSAVVSTTSSDADYQTQYEVQILEMNADLAVFDIRDAQTGEATRYSSEDGHQSAIPLVLGVALAATILQRLLAAAAAVVVGGLTYVLASEAISAIKRNGSNYQHFRASIISGLLYLSDGLSLVAAIQWGRSGNDTWSRSEAGARAVARGIKAGRLPVGPEVHGPGNYLHFHPEKRAPSMHAFFGVAQ